MNGLDLLYSLDKTNIELYRVLTQSTIMDVRKELVKYIKEVLAFRNCDFIYISMDYETETILTESGYNFQKECKNDNTDLYIPVLKRVYRRKIGSWSFKKEAVWNSKLKTEIPWHYIEKEITYVHFLIELNKTKTIHKFIDYILKN